MLRISQPGLIAKLTGIIKEFDPTGESWVLNDAKLSDGDYQKLQEIWASGKTATLTYPAPEGENRLQINVIIDHVDGTKSLEGWLTTIELSRAED